MTLYINNICIHKDVSSLLNIKKDNLILPTVKGATPDDMVSFYLTSKDLPITHASTLLNRALIHIWVHRFNHSLCEIENNTQIINYIYNNYHKKLKNCHHKHLLRDKVPRIDNRGIIHMNRYAIYHCKKTDHPAYGKISLIHKKIQRRNDGKMYYNDGMAMCTSSTNLENLLLAGIRKNIILNFDEPPTPLKEIIENCDISYIMKYEMRTWRLHKDCKTLEYFFADYPHFVDVSKWDFSNVEYLCGTFKNCNLCAGIENCHFNDDCDFDYTFENSDIKVAPALHCNFFDNVFKNCQYLEDVSKIKHTVIGEMITLYKNIKKYFNNCEVIFHDISDLENLVNEDTKYIFKHCTIYMGYNNMVYLDVNKRLKEKYPNFKDICHKCETYYDDESDDEEEHMTSYELFEELNREWSEYVAHYGSP